MKVLIGDSERYYDERLSHQLDALKMAVHQDLDGLIYIFGREGGGKTTLAFQLAMYLDPSFNIEKVAWTPEQFISLVKNAKQYDCIVLDEAYLTFTNQNRLNHFQKVIIGLLTMIRSKNLFIIIVSPTFFDLNKYLIVHRSIAAFRVYFKGNANGIERGYWEMYGEDSKLKLYIRGRRDNDLSVHQADMRGRFTKWFPVNIEEYKKRKDQAVMSLQLENEKNTHSLDYDARKKYRIEGAVWAYKQLDLMDCLNYNGRKPREVLAAALHLLPGSFSNKLTKYQSYSPFDIGNATNNTSSLSSRDILTLPGDAAGDSDHEE